MSTLHGLSDSDPIWDAIYDQDDFVHLDRSETDPLMQVVAAELRRLAVIHEPHVDRDLSRSEVLYLEGIACVVKYLRFRADELTGSPSPLPGGEER